MFEEDVTAGETVMACNGEFVAAGGARFDAIFGDGHLSDNPAAGAGSVTAGAMHQDIMAEPMAAPEEMEPEAPASSRKEKGRR